MKKRILALVLFTAIAGITVFAQNALIEGTVTQSGSGTALPGALVYLENTTKGTATNGKGHFTIKEVPPSTHTIVISNTGYHTEKKEVVVSENEVLKLEFSMTESVLDLPAVVVQSVTLTGGETGIKDVPGSAYYISPKEIQKFSYTDINRTLRAIPGVNLQEEDGFGLRPNIGLRGTGVERSSKITVMEDGVLMAPAPYAAPSAYYFPTTGRMQAIEILKGSSQIKYGPYTTGGAINLISTQIPRDFSGRVHAIGGSYGARNIHANIGNSHNNFGYLVETFQYSADGFKRLDGGGNTGFNKQDYLAKFRINTNSTAKVYQSLTFKMGQVTETSNETYLGLSDADFEKDPLRRYAASQKDQMNTSQSQFTLTHVARFSESLDLTTTAYRTDFHRNWYKLDKITDSTGAKTKIAALLKDPTAYNDAYAVLTGSSSVNDNALHVKANNRSYYAQDVQTVLGYSFTTGAFAHNINAGLRYHQDQIDRFQWVDEYRMDDGVMALTKGGEHGTESNRIETANAFATYLQYKLEYGNFTAVPGIRHENITLHRQDYGKEDPNRTGADLSERSNAISVLIPGIGLDYEFTGYLSTFAGIHKGFSSPGSKEGTKPEESWNYEVGVRYAKHALAGKAVVFYNSYQNLLGADLAANGGDGTADLYNGGEAVSKGLELQLTYDLLSRGSTDFRLPFSVVYTYTNAIFKSGFDSEFGGWGEVQKGDQLPYLAPNQLSLLLSLEHQKFSINLSSKYMDAMRTQAGQGAIPDNQKTDAYFIVDASAGYRLHHKVALFASATNLSNEVYIVARRPAGSRPGMPRAFNLGIKADF